MNVIKQGTRCFIDATAIKDATGAQLNVTGYTVRAVARANHPRGAVIAEWHTSQGTAIAGGAVIDRVRLDVKPSQTTPWTCARVVVQAEMHPGDPELATRIIDETYDVSPEAVV